MNRKWMAAATLAAFGAIAIPVAAVAQQHEGHHRHGRGEMGMMGFGLGRLGKLRERLNLSDAQVSQLRDIAGSVREQNSSLRATMKSGMGDAAKVLLANPNDVARASSILDQNDAARRQMRENMLRGVSRALNVLTPQQRTQLGEILAERQQRHAEEAGRF